MAFKIGSKIIYQFGSPISGLIEVKEQMGKPVLYVEQVPQSGGIVDDIWKKGVKNLPDLGKNPNILILGLGGGTAVGFLKKRWPNCRITGVELDPNIVTVSRTYFGLDQVKNLKIITGDAQKLVMGKKSEIKKVNYDLIMIDIYLSDDAPNFVFDQKFLESTHSLLKKKGVLLVNCLMNEEGRRKIGQFYQVFKRLFPKVKSVSVVSNELVYGMQE